MSFLRRINPTKVVTDFNELIVIIKHIYLLAVVYGSLESRVEIVMVSSLLAEQFVTLMIVDILTTT